MAPFIIEGDNIRSTRDGSAGDRLACTAARAKIFGMLPFVVAMLLSVSAVASAQSRACAGVTMPESVVVDGTTLQLNGLGLREATILSVDVLVAALYVEHRSTKAQVLLNTDERVRVVLQFVRATSASEIRDDLSDSFDANAPQASSIHKRQFLGWVTDLSAGDTMTFTYVPGAGLEVKVRNRVQGTIASRDFARAVLSTLIGRHPQSESLRAALLAAK